jgi:hypothetical protein
VPDVVAPSLQLLGPVLSLADELAYMAMLVLGTCSGWACCVVAVGNAGASSFP